MVDLKRSIVISALLLLFVVSPLVSVVNAQNYGRTFSLLDRPNGSVAYSLTVSITSSLYNYYQGKSHDIYTSSDFGKLVTPDAVKPIADALWQVYSDAEIFTDAVLGITHQIPYEVYPEVYPVETLVLNKGDCGGFSLLAASILKAGGLDVVLLEYPTKQHLNVGVSLPHKPVYARGGSVYYVVYNGKTYYIAETTGDNFPYGWRVGECPTELRSVNPNVIAIVNYEETAPSRVLASFTSLTPSQITISISSFFAVENSAITISGIVSPSTTGNVTIYVSSLGGVWSKLAIVSVNNNGTYAYEWRPQGGGIFYLEASWSGNKNYAGADSPVVSLLVLPFYGLVAGVLGLMMLILVVVFWLINKRGTLPPESSAVEESQPPTPPPPEEIRPSEASSRTPPSAEQETPAENQNQQPQKDQPPLDENPASQQETAPPQENQPQQQTQPEQQPTEQTPQEIKESPPPETPLQPPPSTEENKQPPQETPTDTPT
ncbi:MAG: Ig-like domain-containing protein [Candidatus Bathyarchaeia archaeon]